MAQKNVDRKKMGHQNIGIYPEVDLQLQSAHHNIVINNK